MNDPVADRIDEYLNMIDAETDEWFPASFDEWAEVKRRMGITIPRGLDAYCQYSTERVRHAERTGRAALIYFGAIDDDDIAASLED